MKPFRHITLTIFNSCLFFASYAQIYTDEVQVVEGLGGKVGIGVSPAQYRLHVEGNDPILKGRGLSASLKIRNTSYSESAIGYGFFEHDAYGDVLLGATRSDDPINLGFLRFYAGGTEKMVVSGDGNVGIGTPTPGAKLDVNGPIQVSSQPQYGPVTLESYGLLNLGTNGGGDIYIEPMPGRTFYVVPYDWSDNLTTQFYGKVQIRNGMTLAGTGATHINLPLDQVSFLYESGSATSFLKMPGAGNYTITHEINSTGYHLSQNASSRDIRVISYSNGVRLAPGAGSWAAVSDIRLKENIEPVINSLSRVMDWRSITYTLKEDDDEANAKRRVGVVAQDIAKTRPEAVSQDEDGYYSVRYTELIPDMIAAIQEMKRDYDNQLERLYELAAEQKETIEELRKENNKLNSERK